MTNKTLSKEELIHDLEQQIDFAEECKRKFNNRMENIISNLKELRHNQKYGD